MAAAISELAGLRERVRALEAIVSASSSDRRPVQSSAEQALSASAMAPVQERELEARAQDPVDWMALERFAVRWGDRADARNERALALVGPADLARRFGPPTRIHAANGSLLWEYESSEKNAAGAPLTVVRFIVVDGCVLEVDRRSNL
ncbi:MAG: hypothetical protein KDC48_06720 [Planctomycetes bacterium]|nr:hypothetical protein [Planctomycetota bacterium]